MGFRSYQPSELTTLQAELGHLLARIWKWKMVNEEAPFAGRRLSADRPVTLRLNRITRSILQQEVDTVRDGLRRAQNSTLPSPPVSEPSTQASASRDKWDVEEEILIGKQPPVRSASDIPSYLNSTAFHSWQRELQEFRQRKAEARKQEENKEDL